MRITETRTGQTTTIPRRLRLAALTRDQYTCQDCGHVGESGFRSGNVQVHHIRPRILGGPDSLDNLITLCLPCHGKRERKHRAIAARWGSAQRLRSFWARLGKPLEPELAAKCDRWEREYIEERGG